MMKIFLAWAGPAAKSMAEFLREWLSDVIQEAEPFVSDVDLVKGTNWRLGLESAVKEAKAAIICLAADGITSPWVHWESGGLYHRGLITAPLLLGISPKDLGDPLGSLQVTQVEKADILKLVAAINATAQRPLPQEKLSKSVDLHWNELKQAAEKAIKLSKAPAPPRKSPEQLAEELLERLSGLQKSLDYASRVFGGDSMIVVSPIDRFVAAVNDLKNMHSVSAAARPSFPGFGPPA